MIDPDAVVERRTHPEGVDLDHEVRVIGIEVAAIVTDPRTHQTLEEELEMFAVRHTFPASATSFYGQRRPQLKITVHTSAGDRQAVIPL